MDKSIKDSCIDRVFQNLKQEIIKQKKNKKNSEKTIEKYVVENIYNNLLYSIEDNINKNYILERFDKIKNYQEKLENVKKIPVIVQRTDEWFNTRKNLVTASDMAQALNKGKFGTQKDFMIKKITNLLSNNNVYIQSDSPPLVWGTKFEEVANKIYMKRNNVKVFEFGLIKHPTIKCFGASPDGISELGIMLEIKCPFKRKINGSIPDQYWMQIQGQLEVCNLEECDYLECELSEYENETEFIEDVENENVLTKDYKEKGIIIEKNVNDEKIYIYSDLNKTVGELINWKEEVITEFDITTEYVVYYWRLDQYYCTRVYRDKEFFNNNIEDIKFLWDKILYYKNNPNEYISDIKKNKKGKIYDFNDKYIVKDVEINGFAII